MKSRYRLAILSVAASGLFPCSFDTSPAFIPGNRPEQLDPRFVAGELGILTSTLEKKYELIAWRYLSGLPLSRDEQKSVIAPAAQPGPRGTDVWEHAHHGTGVEAPQYFAFLDTSKASRIAPGQFYTNCLQGAFSSATATLTDRQQKYSSPYMVARWVRAQDTVFENCSGDKAVYPDEPDSGMAPLARADRLYQIAAAHFYAEDLDGAETRFRAIGADYMVGRTLIRKYSLLGDEQALRQAQEALRAIPASSPFHDSAQGLLRMIQAERHPEDLYRDLAKRLATTQPGQDFEKTLDESVYAMKSDRYRKTFTTADLAEPFDWVRSLESHSPAHAIEQWKQNHSTAWLTAALINSSGPEVDVPNLIDAALEAPKSSPGFDTILSNAIRLMIARGEAVRARHALVPLVGQKHALYSVENAYREERLSVATGFDDFLRWAPRRPIGYADDDLSDQPIDSSPVLAEDSVYMLNRQTPLSRLADAAGSRLLPAWIAVQIAHIAWTRAFLLNNTEIERRMRPIVAKVHPAWRMEGATDFQAVLMMLRHSELTQNLPVDFRKAGWPGERWCALKPVEEHSPAATVLSAAEREEAVREVQHLGDLGAEQAALAPMVNARFKSNPDDPDIPEALHRLVLLTRYGCRPDPQNAAISRQAFDALHQRFPGNPWTALTPYWFKD